MANKRPLTPANTNANSKMRFDISQIKPVIMKRSEIYNHQNPTVTVASALLVPPSSSSCSSSGNNSKVSNRADTNNVRLQSCLRRQTKSSSWSNNAPPTKNLNNLTVGTQQRRNNNHDGVACSVQFRTNVTVRRIPNRFDYSESVRADLWSSLQEIRENALRNEAEFSFDGAQWQHCSEEEDFFYDKRSGSLVHPAHVETVCVFNGFEWKPISKDENVITVPTAAAAAMTATSMATALPPPITTPPLMMEEEGLLLDQPVIRQDLETGLLPSSQVCIVCDIGRE